MENARSSEFLNPKFGRQYVANGLSNIPGAFFVYRSNGEEELLYANKELLKIFECETEEQFLELSEGNFKGLVHPDDREAARTSIRRQLDAFMRFLCRHPWAGLLLCPFVVALIAYGSTKPEPIAVCIR